ncbi:hypothetical protein B0H17DRAFT_1187083 [Mycena rosella]|uniref:Uncharacterized protein n=1 Tax=Mycena rosella TaxID=1033263 RepID=A0AAD7FTQ9_MYCRO|nr:hypothetical protein B0H17DRAFT_1187083 [Mycena rosella]
MKGTSRSLHWSTFDIPAGCQRWMRKRILGELRVIDGHAAELALGRVECPCRLSVWDEGEVPELVFVREPGEEGAECSVVDLESAGRNKDQLGHGELTPGTSAKILYFPTPVIDWTLLKEREDREEMKRTWHGFSGSPRSSDVLNPLNSAMKAGAIRVIWVRQRVGLSSKLEEKKVVTEDGNLGGLDGWRGSACSEKRGTERS